MSEAFGNRTFVLQSLDLQWRSQRGRGQWGQLPPPLAENPELHCILLLHNLQFTGHRHAIVTVIEPLTLTAKERLLTCTSFYRALLIICLSVRYVPVPDENGLTYRQFFFTIR